MALTPAEIESVINAYIIDNNTNQVTPAKMRFVLKTINNAIQQTDASAVFAVEPLFFDPFTNQFFISKVSALQDGYLSKEDYASMLSLPKIQFVANGTNATFDLETSAKVKAVFWNGALLNDSDWSQNVNALTLTFTPDSGAIIKPI